MNMRDVLLDGDNLDLDVLAALTHLNEVLEYKEGTCRLEEAQKNNEVKFLNQLYENANTYLSKPLEIKKINPALTAKQTGLSQLFWAIACLKSSEEISTLINNPESMEENYRIGEDVFTPIYYAISIKNLTAVATMTRMYPAIIFQRPPHVAKAQDPTTHPYVLQQVQELNAKLRSSYLELKQNEDTLIKDNPAHQPSAELLHAKELLASTDSILSCFIHCNASRNSEFRVAANLLLYIEEREKKPAHITDNSKVGKYSLVSSFFSQVAKIADNIGVPILYTGDEKIDACRQLLANIIHEVKNPIQALPEAQQKILEQGSLAKVVEPLQPTSKTSEQNNTKRNSLGSSH